MSRPALHGLLAVALLFFLFDGAVHSVHHLDSDEAEADCSLASAAGSISILGPDEVVLADIRPVVVTLVPELAPCAPVLCACDLVHDRAPPASLSV
jgi:hypothetical protein